MANWFKSDISIYDRDDFIEATSQCHHLPLVWEWVQRESIKQGVETVKIKNNLHLTSICKRLHITEIELQQALSLLGELELLIFDDYKNLTLPNWLLNQGIYFAEKERNRSKIAEWREKNQAKKSKDVTVTNQLHNSYSTVTQELRNGNVTDCNRLEERRGEEKRIEKRGEEKEIFVEPENFASPESPPSFSFYDETEAFYEASGVFLQSKDKALSLIETVSQDFPDLRKLKSLLEKAIAKKPDKYLQPFGFINFLEWLISNKQELQRKTDPIKTSTYTPPPDITEEERQKAFEARDRKKRELESKGILRSNSIEPVEKPPSGFPFESKDERMAVARKIIARKGVLA